MNTKTLIVIFLLVVSGFLFYTASENTGQVVLETKSAFVIRIIDGDTIETDIGKIRLLGINTPERKMPLHDEALTFLQNLVVNKSVQIETIKGNEKDKYDRTLAYIFYNGIFVNKEILAEGLGNLYYYNEDKYIDELKKAEEQARENEKGIWRKSSRSVCFKLVKLQWQEQTRCNNKEVLMLENECGKSINIILKDSANHILKENIAQGTWTRNFSCVWNDEGDSLFVWDEQGLVVYYSY